jgi:DNA polymerase III alpha subunit (gram-positive type)
MAEPARGSPLVRQSAKRALATAPQALLGLEDTIAVGSALVALRVGFTIVYVETAGPDPLHDEILSVHALQVDRHRVVAEFNTKVQPLRALASPEAGDDDADRPPAKRQPTIPLERAMAGLCRFLGTHRQHVFVHGAASAQTFLGQAARHYGLTIENPVGDLVDLARLAWPDRSDYSLAGLVADLLPESSPIRTSSDATKAIQALLEVSSKRLTAEGGLVSRSIGHWGRSPDTFTLKPSPW